MEFKQHGKKLLGDSFIYGLSSIITSFIGVLLVPLYTKVFQPADYGIIALLGSLQTIATIFIVFGMDNSFAVWYWEHPTDKGRATSTSNWFFFSLILGFLTALLLASCSCFIASSLLGSSHLYPLVILFAINIFLASTQRILNSWFRIRRQPVHAVSFNIIISLLTIGLNVWLVLFKHLGISGIYYSGCIASLVSLVISVIVLRKYISFKFINLKEMRTMIKFSLPLVPTGLIFWVMGAATPYFINFLMHDKAEIGLYQIGSTCANLLGLGTFAFLQAFTSYALSISRDENAKNIYAKVFEYYIYIGMGCALLLGVLARFILHIFTNKNYLPSYVVIGILAFNVIISGAIQIITLANLLAKDNKPIAKSAMFSVLITIAGYGTLIPLLGKEGAAIAVLAGNLATTIYVTLRAQKLYFIPYNFKRIVTYTVSTVIVYMGYLILFN